MKIQEHCKTALHNQAVVETTSKLPQHMVVDYVLGSKREQKLWNSHKVSKSNILLPKGKGRPSILRNSGLKPKDNAFGSTFSNSNNGGIFVPQIYGLHKCTTEKEKLNLIAKAHIAPEIKAELLAFHCSSMLGGL